MISYTSIPKEFRQLWLLGHTIKYIAHKLNISYYAVRYWRRKLNLPARPIGRHSRWYNESFTIKQKS